MRFEIVQGDEQLSSHSGLALVGAILDRTNIRERLDAVVLPEHPFPEISHGEVATAMIGLIGVGKPDFDAIEPFRKDPFFAQSLGLDSVPSSPTLRQRLDSARGVFNDIILEESAGVVGRLAPVITPCHGNLVAVDIDVSPFDNSKTKKEGVSWTYKKVDGYAPIFGYVGEEGYLANLELRPGSDHSQKGTEAFLRQTLRHARVMSEATFLVRMDSGNDSLGNIKVCREEKAHYIIKRNLRRETPEEWLEIARECGEMEEPRPGKQVWRGERYIKRGGIAEPLRIAFCVTVRTVEADGQALLMPNVEVETYWTSLPDDPGTVVKLYQAHGTSEQFHSELKTDLDLERLPSGKFQTNELVLLLGMVTYNLLRLIGQESLQEVDAPIRKQVARRRVRSVMQDLVYLACRLVRHARYLRLSFGRHCPWFDTWRRVYYQFAPT
ncbi:IS1380 family transposase [Dehalococcoidia bacterium]|nr:IS1380 family transposase [Dehalococcoidia bacterium]